MLGNIAEEKIFGNALICEKILKFLIFTSDFKIDHEMVKTVRLVQKQWLERTSTLLKMSALPIIVIKINGNDLQHKEKLQRLNQILTTLTSPERLVSSVLPFKLIISPTYFVEENYQSLLKCLTVIGNELMELYVSFPKDGGTMSLKFPEFTLPVLRKMSFEFSSNNIYGYYGSSCKNENGLLLLQQILNATKTLTTFVFPLSFCAQFPKNFVSLRLPNSVISVEIQDNIRVEYWDLFMDNQLLNIRRLIIKLPTNHSERDILLNILNRFSKSLICLQLVGEEHRRNEEMVLTFPKLEKLETVQIKGTQSELDSKSAINLQKLFPNVKHVGLTYQTEAALNKWIRKSKFEKVESLNVSSVVEYRKYGDDPFISLNFEMLAQVHRAFPNVSKLEITVNIKDVSGLMYFFQYMAQLKHLRINIREEVLTDDKWKYESIIVGLPAWLISAHEEKSEFFKSFLLKRGRKPCLLNLTRLTCFTLWLHTRNGEKIILSDLLFRQIFFKMPSLVNITLSKVVQPTEQMAEEWKSQGRRIEYIAVEDKMPNLNFQY